MMAYIGVAAAAAVAQAVKASGAIVRMKPEEFMTLLDRTEEPLVVMATGGVINKNFQYLMGFKGLAFYTKSSEKLPLPPKADLIVADNIWIPA
jgi:hypothetical protein